MAKYLILYKSTMSASDTMASATPEQMKASMDEWIAWKDEVSKTASFEFGMPLQAAAKVTADGVSASTSQASGYAIMEGDKDIITKALQTHPHLKRPGASIEVLEMLPMPGM